MAEQIITCEDCGQPRKTRHKNTKKCKECRFLADISYPHRMRKCMCGERFQPIRRGDELCGEHAYDSRNMVTCAFCARDDYSVFEDLKVCSACARNPIYRKRFVGSLENRKANRAATITQELAV